MNINPSQYLRAIIGLFFVFILFFPGMAQASTFQKMTRSLTSDVSQSQKEKIFGFFEDLGIKKPKNLSENEVRELIRAWDDPIRLIENSPNGPFGTDFTGHASPRKAYINRSFFFARFDFHKNSDALFIKLFSKGNGNKELPFQEAKRNWENFLGAVRLANTSFTETDLEAAAISFIHQKYFPNMDSSFRPHSRRSWTRFLEEESLGTFFHNQFNIGHYINPHFTLTSENYYYGLIMKMTLDPSFLKEGKNLSLRNSKEFVLRIWNDVTEEISRGRVKGVSNSVFLELITDSIIMCRKLPEGSSIEENHFLKAMVEAAREDNRLVQLVDIVDEFVTGTGRTSEDYRPYILRQFIESSGLEENMIHRLLYRYGLQDEDLALRSQRHSDPVDAGTHL